MIFPNNVLVTLSWNLHLNNVTREREAEDPWHESIPERMVLTSSITVVPSPTYLACHQRELRRHPKTPLTCPGSICEPLDYIKVCPNQRALIVCRTPYLRVVRSQVCERNEHKTTQLRDSWHYTIRRDFCTTTGMVNVVVCCTIICYERSYCCECILQLSAPGSPTLITQYVLWKWVCFW